MSRVLVVASQRRLVTTVRRALSNAGCQVAITHTLQDAIATCLAPAPDLVVVDDALPAEGGLALVRHIRSRPDLAMIPILLLATLVDPGAGPGSERWGADVCLAKPPDALQLVASVNTLLLAADARPRPATLVSGPVRLDVGSGTAWVEGMPVALTPVELRLLLFLLGHSGEAVPAGILLEQVWGYPPGSGSSSLVRMHILNLRGKLEADPHNPRLLRTLPKHGYVWSG